MSKKKRWVPVLLSLSVAGTMAAACSSGKEPNAEKPPSQAPAATASTGAAATYPLTTDKTLTYWGELSTGLTGIKTSHAEVPFYQELQKQTGIKINFTSPPVNQTKEALNVLLASGSLPDMIEYSWLSFPGGPEKAIQDGYILKLNDVFENYAPNLMKYLKAHPEVDKMLKTDNGSYYAFPFIRGEPYLQVWQGPIIRKDWLDDVGLPVPETIDEWHTALKAFKEKKGAAAPLSVLSTPRPFNHINNGAFVSAFGVTRDFYLDDKGEIKFGPAEQGYKQFLSTFRQWYAEGLLDKNIATIDGKTLDANIVSGSTGGTIGASGGGIGKWAPLLTAKDSKAKLVAAPYPVLKKGDIPMYGLKDDMFAPAGMVAITAKSKNVELAARLLDYGYSEAGHLLYNFGIEGVSYKMENNYPAYTDIVKNNPDKLALSQAMSLYMRSNSNGPFIQDRRYLEQYLQLPEQKEAVEIWSKTDTDKHKLPPVTATPEESSELAKIVTDIDTLVDEMTLKIILGVEPVDAFDSYVQKFKSLKLDQAIAIKKAALDRYNKR